MDCTVYRELYCMRGGTPSRGKCYLHRKSWWQRIPCSPCGKNSASVTRTTTLLQHTVPTCCRTVRYARPRS